MTTTQNTTETAPMTGHPARSAEDDAEMARLLDIAEDTEDYTEAHAFGIAADVRACERVAAKLERWMAEDPTKDYTDKIAQLREMGAWIASR